jgi:hypothetical protein
MLLQMLDAFQHKLTRFIFFAHLRLEIHANANWDVFSLDVRATEKGVAAQKPRASGLTFLRVPCKSSFSFDGSSAIRRKQPRGDASIGSIV